MAEKSYTMRMAADVTINERTSKLPFLVIDGEPFPFLIDKKHGVQVIANDEHVHLVIVAIQVDRSVTVTDHGSDGRDYQPIEVTRTYEG